MESILLASGSPRRRELLEGAGIPFDVILPEVDESLRDSLRPSSRVLALAEDKARAVSGRSPHRLILAADTLVCVEDEAAPGGEAALGKPKGLEEARSMLRLLSGREHFVRTGVALLDQASGELRSARSDTAVRFCALSDDEVEGYLASGEWEGVAGAYRIQEIAAFFVEGIAGSWSGVVGLPLHELYVILKEAGYRVPSLRTRH